MSTTMFKDFKVLAPVPIADAGLVASSVAEPDAARVMVDGSVGEVQWVTGTTYTQNQRVVLASTHRVYRDAVGGVSNSSPAFDPIRWVDEGPTNKWAWHDGQNATATASASPYSQTVRPGPITHIGFGGLVGVATIRVEMWDEPGGTLVHDQIYGNEDIAGVDPHWALYFLAPEYADMALVSGLPVHPDCEVRITLTGYSSAVGVGLIAHGMAAAVGTAEMGATVSIRDYGYTTTDKWGNSIRTPGSKGIDLSCSGVATIAQANGIRRTLLDLLDVGAMYFPSDNPAYRFMWTWGQLQPGKITPDTARTVRVEFEIEGKI